MIELGIPQHGVGESTLQQMRLSVANSSTKTHLMVSPRVSCLLRVVGEMEGESLWSRRLRVDPDFVLPGPGLG